MALYQHLYSTASQFAGFLRRSGSVICLFALDRKDQRENTSANTSCWVGRRALKGQVINICLGFPKVNFVPVALYGKLAEKKKKKVKNN